MTRCHPTNERIRFKERPRRPFTKMPKFEIVSPVKLKTQSIKLVSIVTAAGHFVRIHN